jgi:hypothetical protein
MKALKIIESEFWIKFNVLVKDKRGKKRYAFVKWTDDYERARREFESWITLWECVELVCRTDKDKRRGGKTVIHSFDPNRC